MTATPTNSHVKAVEKSSDDQERFFEEVSKWPSIAVRGLRELPEEPPEELLVFAFLVSDVSVNVQSSERWYFKICQGNVDNIVKDNVFLTDPHR